MLPDRFMNRMACEQRTDGRVLYGEWTECVLYKYLFKSDKDQRTYMLSVTKHPARRGTEEPTVKENKSTTPA